MVGLAGARCELASADAMPRQKRISRIRAQHSLIHRDRDFDPFEEFLELSIIHA